MTEQLPATITTAPISGEIIEPGDRSVRVVACPHPLRSKHEEHTFAAGVTLAEIVDAVQPKAGMRHWSQVYIGDMPISTAMLHRIRPKPGTLVNVKFVPQGGNNAKVLRLVLVLAATALSIAFPYMAPIFYAAYPVLSAVIMAAIPVVVPIIGPALVGSTNPPRFKCLFSAEH